VGHDVATKGKHRQWLASHCQETIFFKAHWGAVATPRSSRSINYQFVKQTGRSLSTRKTGTRQPRGQKKADPQGSADESVHLLGR
jgi:hypothetical protein